MKRCVSVAVVLVLACTLSPALYAGDNDMKAPTKGFRAEYLHQLKDTQSKIVELAEAVPAEKYAWRPEEGVRSIGEVYTHIAGANYLFPSFLGMKTEGAVTGEMEKTVTDKAKIIELLTTSFDNLRNTVLNETDAGLDREVVMFGSTVTARTVLMVAMSHLHEHLGQSIAYARTNHIVPPWTAREQAAAKAKSK
jgi:uncharacterized damage-inducible protein DinB